MNTKKKLYLSSFLCVITLTGCDNPVEKVIHLSSGYLQETIAQNMNQGKGADDLRKVNLEVIKRGVADLETMNDPNIDEIYKVIDKSLKDNELSMYDYNTITSKIHKHKVDINKQNSTHQNDVENFKNNL